MSGSLSREDTYKAELQTYLESMQVGAEEVKRQYGELSSKAPRIVSIVYERWKTEFEQAMRIYGKPGTGRPRYSEAISN